MKRIACILLAMLSLCQCAPVPENGTYHFSWTVKVVDPGLMAPGLTTQTISRRDQVGLNEWEIIGYTLCYDLVDMEDEMRVMMTSIPY